MNDRTQSPLAIFGACLFGLMACRQDPVEDLLDNFLVQEGEYSIYYSDPATVTCAGNAAHVDGFVPFVADQLTLKPRGQVHIAWLNQDQITEVGCARGCQIDKYALSTLPIHLHEIVHVVTGQHDLNGWPYFTEGVATAYDWWSLAQYGPRYVQAIVPGDPLPDPREMMLSANSEDEYLHYGIAASFVTLLLARHGPEKLVELMRTPVPNTMQEAEAIFRGVYGTELDAEVELFKHGAACTPDMFPVIPYDCAMPEIEWLDDRQWEHLKSLDCRQPGVAGGIRDADVRPSHHSVTLEVPKRGAHQLAVESDEDVTVQIGECFGCPWEHRYHLLKPGDAYTVDLEAGRHYVRIVATSDSSPMVRVVVAPNPLADPGP